MRREGLVSHSSAMATQVSAEQRKAMAERRLYGNGKAMIRSEEQRHGEEIESIAEVKRS